MQGRESPGPGQSREDLTLVHCFHGTGTGFCLFYLYIVSTHHPVRFPYDYSHCSQPLNRWEAETMSSPKGSMLFSRDSVSMTISGHQGSSPGLTYMVVFLNAHMLLFPKSGPSLHTHGCLPEFQGSDSWLGLEQILLWLGASLLSFPGSKESIPKEECSFIFFLKNFQTQMVVPTSPSIHGCCNSTKAQRRWWCVLHPWGPMASSKAHMPEVAQTPANLSRCHTHF